MTDTFCSLRTPCGGACGLSAHVSHTVHVCRDSRCALCHSTTPTQATGSGTMIWHKPLKRDEVDCAQFAQPDPRDARIAELEAALREVRKLADVNDGRTDWKRLQDAGQIARTALMPSPERDMKMAQEELDA